MVPQKNLSVSDGEVFLNLKNVQQQHVHNNNQAMKLQVNNSPKLMLKGSHDIFLKLSTLNLKNLKTF